ncbi:AEC family transporter [Musicola keenii]|uniref:AEC family transporter n=1 Tax=Musicola keenii TaxID=2884250 RepID=UPI00177B595E|nr:AEC family transporter [Musicola keenii]
MVDVLIKALSFILVIVIGYQLKQRGILQQQSASALSKLMMNFTLPAAVITGFASFKVDHSLLILVALGLGCNLVLLGVGYLIGRRRPEGLKAFYMINSPGYNIGCFTLPYVQSFLGPVGIVATCLFDAGNSVICTGGSFAVASAATGKSSGWLNIVKRLFSSVPFDVYVLLMIAALMGWHLPSQITLLVSTLGNANPFVAMLIIGMLLEVNIDRSQLKHVLTVLLLRYTSAAAFASLFYFFTPLPLEIRQVLAVVVFAPLSSLSPLFTARFNGNLAVVASFANSLSIMISILTITTLLTTMQL